MLVSQGAPSISGFSQEVKIDKNLEPGLRVTVRLDQKQLPGVGNFLDNLPGSVAPFHHLLFTPLLSSLFLESKTYRGKVVSSEDPRTKAGLYWGYTVRLASCLSKQSTSSCSGIPPKASVGSLESASPSFTPSLLPWRLSFARLLFRTSDWESPRI